MLNALTLPAILDAKVQTWDVEVWSRRKHFGDITLDVNSIDIMVDLRFPT